MARVTRGSGLGPMPPIVAPRLTPIASILLIVAALLFIASLPIPWHHDVIPAAGYRVVRGIDGASWLVVATAVVIAFAVRYLVRPPAFPSKWFLVGLTFCVTLGMIIDYIDWQSSAAFLYTRAYFGPGFYVALTGAAVLVVATVQAWRSSL